MRRIDHVEPGGEPTGSAQPQDGVTEQGKVESTKKKERKSKASTTKKEPKKKEPKKKKKGESQEELPGMPKLDGLAKAGRRMRLAIEELDKAKDERGAAEDTLIKALKKGRRTSIQIDGYKFQFKHTGPSDKITVQKPK